ncbi:hypothetical protein EVAR_37003_1 [Eumeta japonica]|uniref:Uncharacterized protein n=1 Tax=Eumeta variegata TaxID=151549 RepID=A0A4C1X377_EUMVA|nr:hypothetical protein EVAR_37003_1 [Eumeta japonica]
MRVGKNCVLEVFLWSNVLLHTKLNNSVVICTAEDNENLIENRIGNVITIQRIVSRYKRGRNSYCDGHADRAAGYMVYWKGTLESPWILESCVSIQTKRLASVFGTGHARSECVANTSRLHSEDVADACQYATFSSRVGSEFTTYNTLSNKMDFDEETLLLILSLRRRRRRKRKHGRI